MVELAIVFVLFVIGAVVIEAGIIVAVFFGKVFRDDK